VPSKRCQVLPTIYCDPSLSEPVQKAADVKETTIRLRPWPRIQCSSMTANKLRNMTTLVATQRGQLSDNFPHTDKIMAIYNSLVASACVNKRSSMRTSWQDVVRLFYC